MNNSVSRSKPQKKKILANIPMNIITGFLGAGKTTAIRHLLANKPENQKWAVLVNEFGEVGIDGALLEADGIAVKEVAGGCMCCAVGVPSKVALNQLIRDHRPDRILIEPTGLAHPQQVLKQFSGNEYRTLLDIQAVICLVDPRSLNDENFTSLAAFHSQIEMADIIVATKMDLLSSQEKIDIRQKFESDLKPEKTIKEIEKGQIPWHWLLSSHKEQSTTVNANHPKRALTAPSSTPANEFEIAPQLAITKITRHEKQEAFGYSCGWKFPDDWVFNQQAFVNCIEKILVPRIKGIVRVESGIITINRMRDRLSIEQLNQNGEGSTLAAKGMRLEMIHTSAVDWEAVEALLKVCRQR